MKPTEFVWYDGQLVPWDQATAHVGVHALQYGSSVFEGIRAYPLPEGPAVFCLDAHLERMYASCKVYRMEIPFSHAQLHDAVLATIRANRLNGCYIRPIAFRGLGTFSLDGRRCPTHVAILTIEMGKYLGPEALDKGVAVGISSWRRMAPGTLPAAAKIGGQYINSQLITMEAIDHGYVEGIALDAAGYLSEGAGENVFVARHGTLSTPPLASSILDGITRRCVITLAREAGMTVIEQQIPRELIYSADEVFFCGTAAEITPITSVDGIQISDGRRGPNTTQLMEAFFEIVEGRTADRHDWLTPVN